MHVLGLVEGKQEKTFLLQETHDTSVSRFTSSWCILLVPQVPTGHRVNVVRLYGACYVSGCDFVRISCLAVGSTVAFFEADTYFLYYKQVRFREKPVRPTKTDKLRGGKVPDFRSQSRSWRLAARYEVASDQTTETGCRWTSRLISASASSRCKKRTDWFMCPIHEKLAKL